MSLDIVLHGGRVVDGTGAAPRPADIGIAGDRIAAMGDLAQAACGTRVDCTGLVVSPGFIDIHTHYDPQLLWDPDITPSCGFGVTTIFIGNCGFSIAPMRPENRAICMETLGNTEAMSVDVLKAGIAWEFGSFGEYLRAVERRGPALNVASLLGHTALRLEAMAGDAVRAATPQELRRMQDILAAAMADGAWGFSTSKSPAHVGPGGRPVPSRMADLAEFEALADVLAASNAGVFQGVGGPGLGIAEFAALARRSRRPLTWCSLHQGVDGGKHWEYSRQTAAARAAGADIWATMACSPIIGQFTLERPYVLNSVPCFGSISGLSRQERLRHLTDPAWQAEAARQFAANAERRTFDIRFDRIFLDHSTAHPELVGRSLEDIAGPRPPMQAMVELACADDLATRFKLIMFNYDDDDVAGLLKQESTLLGLGDGGAHITQLCDSAYPLHLLGHFVRKRGDFPLEFAIWRLTGQPAAIYGLADRGVLRQGAYADICAFDAATVDESPLRRVFDQPAGGERLVKDAIGMQHVLVNGKFIRRDGANIAGTAAGRMLRP